MADTATIRATFERHRAAFRFRTPFGALLAEDMVAVLRCTARDAGATADEIREALGDG